MCKNLFLKTILIYLAKSGKTSKIEQEKKKLSLSGTCYSTRIRYQVPLYLWRIKPVPKHSKWPKFYGQNCRSAHFFRYTISDILFLQSTVKGNLISSIINFAYKLSHEMTNDLHCVKSVQILSFFWSVFSCILTEYGDLRSTSPYSARIQENTEQKKLRIWTLFTQC